MRKEERKALIKVGFFITLLTLIFMIVIVSIGKESGLFEKKSLLTAHTPSAQALKVGAFVELKGLRVGVVSDIKIRDPKTVAITLNVSEDILQWIPKSSQVLISNAGLVGDKFIEIIPGDPESGVFNSESDILTLAPSTELGAIMAKGANAAEASVRVLEQAEKLIMQLSHKDSIPKLIQSLDKTLVTSEAVLQKVNKLPLESTVNQVNHIIQRIDKGPGSMHAFIYDDTLYDGLRKLVGGAERSSLIKYFVRETIKNGEEKKKN